MPLGDTQQCRQNTFKIANIADYWATFNDGCWGAQ